MSDAAVSNLLQALTSVVITAFGAWVTVKLAKLKAGQDVIHDKVNGVTEALVKQTGEQKLAEGNLAGREQLRQEQKDKGDCK